MNYNMKTERVRITNNRTETIYQKGIARVLELQNVEVIILSCKGNPIYALAAPTIVGNLGETHFEEHGSRNRYFGSKLSCGLPTFFEVPPVSSANPLPANRSDQHPMHGCCQCPLPDSVNPGPDPTANNNIGSAGFQPYLGMPRRTNY